MKISKLTLIPCLFFSLSAVCETAVDISYNQLSANLNTLNPTTVKNRTLEVGFKYTASQFIETRVFAGFSTDEYEVRKQYDTFREPFVIDGPIKKVPYRSTAEVKNLAGLELSINLPSTKSIKPSVGIGYIAANWGSDIYSYFTDNEPSSDHLAAIERGDSDCAITGIEILCGTEITKEKDKGRFSTPYATFNVHWNISSRTSIFISGRKGINSSSEFSSLGAGLKFNW